MNLTPEQQAERQYMGGYYREDQAGGACAHCGSQAGTLFMVFDSPVCSATCGLAVARDRVASIDPDGLRDWWVQTERLLRLYEAARGIWYKPPEPV